MAYALLKLLKVDNLFYVYELLISTFHLSIPFNILMIIVRVQPTVCSHLGLLFTLSCHSPYLSFLLYLSYFIGRLGLYPYQLVSGYII
jgi:hypothetical protein